MSFFNLVSSYDDAWKAIIMPPRQEYTAYDLGPKDFTAQGSKVSRTDFRLLNKRGHVIECSFFQHIEIEDPIPCVIYLHANGCSRLEALQYSNLILSNKFSFFCFDFSGCGKSEGEYTSVGWFEQEDLECIIQYVYQTGRVSKVALWGRSMGAVTSLFYLEKDPRISCVILDSAFTKFKRVVKELAKQKASIPEFLTAGAFGMIRKTVLNKAKFDIGALRPIKSVHKMRVPALFGTGSDDTFVSAQHTKDLYSAYGGPKEMMIFEGEHNADRPIKWILKANEFLKKHLLNDKAGPEPLSKLLKNYVKQGEGSLRSTTESLSEISEEKELKNKKAPAKLSEPRKLKKNMGFTWLEHSSSSPQLPSMAKAPKHGASRDQIFQNLANKPNIPYQPINLNIKKDTNKFGPFVAHKFTNIPSKAHMNAQPSYTIEPISRTIPKSENDLNRVKSDGTPKFGLSKPVQNGSLNDLSHPNSEAYLHPSQTHLNLGLSPQAHSLNDLDLLYSNKMKFDEVIYTPMSMTDLKSTPQSQLSYGQNIAGPGPYMASNSNPQPKAYQVGDTPHLTLGSPVQNFSDAYKGHFCDLSTGRHTDKYTPTSNKSYISSEDRSRPREPAHFVAKHGGSDYGFNSLASNHTNLINFKEERRHSDNGYLLKHIVTPGPFVKDTILY